MLNRMEKDNHNNIMLMLGEMRSDIKGLVKSVDTYGPRIDTLERNEITRVARAGVFGAIGGFVVTPLIEYLKMKFFH